MGKVSDALPCLAGDADVNGGAAFSQILGDAMSPGRNQSLFAVASALTVVGSFALATARTWRANRVLASCCFK